MSDGLSLITMRLILTLKFGPLAVAKSWNHIPLRLLVTVRLVPVRCQCWKLTPNPSRE